MHRLILLFSISDSDDTPVAGSPSPFFREVHRVCTICCVVVCFFSRIRVHDDVCFVNDDEIIVYWKKCIKSLTNRFCNHHRELEFEFTMMFVL